MATLSAAPPPWFVRAIAGLAYWLGYKRALFPGYPVPEAAIVTELCALIHAQLPNGYVLRPEERGTKFLPKGVTRPELTDLSRIDLSIWERYLPTGGNRHRNRPIFVVEVKRNSASKPRVLADLKRLAAIVEETEGLRAFLCVASEEAGLLKLFTTPKGRLREGKYPVPETKSSWQVVALRKAAPAFSRPELANYCCIVEVT